MRRPNLLRRLFGPRRCRDCDGASYHETRGMRWPCTTCTPKPKPCRVCGTASTGVCTTCDRTLCGRHLVAVDGAHRPEWTAKPLECGRGLVVVVEDETETFELTRLAHHLASAHCDGRAMYRSDAENLAYHETEHASRGTLRYHSVDSLHFNLDKVEAVLVELEELDPLYDYDSFYETPDDLTAVAEHFDVNPVPTYGEQVIGEEIAETIAILEDPNAMEAIREGQVEMHDICRHRWPIAHTDTDRQHHTLPHLCMVPAYLGVHEYHECVCGAGIDAGVVAG